MRQYYAAEADIKEFEELIEIRKKEIEGIQ